MYRNVTLPETRGTAFAFHTLFDDIGRGLGPLWVSLLIAGTGGRIPGFNLSIGGWFVCSLILFLMIFSVKGDFRKLEIATQASAERRRVGLGEGSLVGTKEMMADGKALEADGPLDSTPVALSAEVVDSDDATKSDPSYGKPSVVADSDDAGKSDPAYGKPSVASEPQAAARSDSSV